MYIEVCWKISYLSAQRLVAQALGRLRFVVTILAGNLKTQLSVRSLSLGQVACSHMLGGIFNHSALFSPIAHLCYIP
jgi:hypothetical protein